MWFTVRVFGVTVLAVGFGFGRGQSWITNTDGCFELAPETVEEYEEEECRIGFH